MISMEDLVWIARYNLPSSEREEFLRIQMPSIDLAPGTPAHYLLYEMPYPKQYPHDCATYFIWHLDTSAPDTTHPYKNRDKALARTPPGSYLIEVPQSELQNGYTHVPWHLCHATWVPLPAQVTLVTDEVSVEHAAPTYPVLTTHLAKG